jgi:hypothetical protein
MKTLSKKDVLIGSILIGDGHLRIQKAGKTPQLEIGHSLKQEEYLKWKCSLLKEYGFEMKIRKVIHNQKGKTYPALVASSGVSDELTSIYNLFYKNKVKLLPKIFVGHFDELLLAILFMDDGSCKVKKKDKGLISETGYIEAFMIATNNFSFDEVEYLSRYLLDKFNIKANVQRDRGKPRLAISSIESKEKLISIVKPYLEQIPSMLYKIDKPIKFKDANFTSRG